MDQIFFTRAKIRAFGQRMTTHGIMIDGKTVKVLKPNTQEFIENNYIDGQLSVGDYNKAIRSIKL
jgi:hypothetical protein